MLTSIRQDSRPVGRLASLLRSVLMGLLLVLGVMAGVSPAWSRGPTIPTVDAAQLPQEARDTLALIRKGGPYPYRQDDTTFGNRERRLPEQARGYYREYTVKTPGSRDRGARRIIAGGQPVSVMYYTDDHYRTFRRIRESP